LNFVEGLAISSVMADRIRLIIDTEEEIRLAVRLAAVKADTSPSELVNSILRKALASEIEDAKRYMPKKKKGSDQQ
jgi:hypothetical protein